MKLAPPPLDIDPYEGFKNTDLFGYKEFGEHLALIVETLDSAVIVLDGPWGSGKTTFTQQWAGLLRQQGHAVVQFDAFANDYQEDAFIALAGAIHACSKDEKPEGIDNLKASFLKSAAGVTKALPSVATRVAVNLITQGALSAGTVSKLVESIESANSSQLEKRIAKTHENTQAINEFRERLTELAKELAQGTASGTDGTKPANETRQKLVFIIDELDRCKPPFALNLLERIKHLFSVDEIVFVLVAHLPQMARIVEREYGVNSGIQYLEKFHHLRIGLPVAHASHQHRHTKYLDYLMRTMDVRTDEPAVLKDVTEGLRALAGVYDLSLRTLQQVVSSIVLVCLATNEQYPRFGPLISGLAVMRIVDPQLYAKARNGLLRLNDALQFLKFDEWNIVNIDEYNVKGHKDEWTYATARTDELPDGLKGYGQWILRFRMTRSDMITTTCKQIDDLWQRERK